MSFKKYVKNSVSEAILFEETMNWPEEQLNKIQFNDELGEPKDGDMIFRDPDNHDDMWWVPKENFEKQFSPAPQGKTYGNTDVSKARDNVSDLEVRGDTDMFKLLCKASSQNEKWMKSTKALHIDGIGCIVQVTTQQGDHVAEALAFVPGVKIEDVVDGSGGRRLVKEF